MSRPEETPLPLTGSGEDAPAFAEPWHAQVFAMTLRLSEQGHFNWPQWAEIFGEELKRAAREGGPADGGDYYEVWLRALERILAERGLAAAEDLQHLKDAWTEAYLATPHGQPVRLK